MGIARSGSGQPRADTKSGHLTSPARAIDGTLVMTTPGDTSMVNAREMEAIITGKRADLIR